METMKKEIVPHGNRVILRSVYTVVTDKLFKSKDKEPVLEGKRYIYRISSDVKDLDAQVGMEVVLSQFAQPQALEADLESVKKKKPRKFDFIMVDRDEIVGHIDSNG